MKKFKSILCLSIVALLICNVAYANTVWLVKTKTSKVSFTLFENGTIERTNRGDPKTDYSKKDNCAHGKSANCLEESKPEITLDISNWLIGSQGSHSDNYHVTYLSPTLRTGDQVVVYYNLIEGTVLNATRQLSSETTELPDLTGFTLDGKVTVRSDGTSQALYLDGRSNIILDYDASGELTRARVHTEEVLSLDSVKIPPYYTETYGWTAGT